MCVKLCCSQETGAKRDLFFATDTAAKAIRGRPGSILEHLVCFYAEPSSFIFNQYFLESGNATEEEEQRLID